MSWGRDTSTPSDPNCLQPHTYKLHACTSCTHTPASTAPLLRLSVCLLLSLHLALLSLTPLVCIRCLSSCLCPPVTGVSCSFLLSPSVSSFCWCPLLCFCLLLSPLCVAVCFFFLACCPLYIYVCLRVLSPSVSFPLCLLLYPNYICVSFNLLSIYLCRLLSPFVCILCSCLHLSPFYISVSFCRFVYICLSLSVSFLYFCLLLSLCLDLCLLLSFFLTWGET